MTPTLTPNEMDALLQAMREGQLDAPGSDPPTREVHPYDLTSSDRVIRGQLPTLDSINDHIASQVAVGLAGRLRAPVDVTTQPARLMKFADFHSQVGPPATFVVLGLGSVSGQAVLVVPEELTRALLAAALGDRQARIDDTPSQTRHDLTGVERSVFSRILGVICDAVGRAWAPVLPVRPQVLRLETDPRLAVVAPPSDVAIVTGLDVKLGEGGGTARLTLSIPFASVETVKKQLSASPRSSSVTDGRYAEHLRELIMELPMELCGVLGRARMSLKDFLAVGQGQVITLDTAEARPLPLLVQGVHKFRGRPQVVAGGLALVMQQAAGQGEEPTADTQVPGG
ncbi:MAG: FliM/FliN family flagellar motor switch protein [Deltaproteobacteria bacterium]|nr:FliM/FliN family flagellar motor switch protein [Deltaproteobacteria bacterium]